MKEFKSFREQSKINYGRNLESNQFIGEDMIKLGAILRIADAIEKMAENHLRLIREKENLRLMVNDLEKQLAKIKHSKSGLKAFVARLKKLKKSK